MGTESLDVQKMSGEEKIALMERLWDSMTDSEYFTEPPEWHEAALREREGEWKDRESVSQDWPEAREEIRRTLK